jgi:hypothetical protein
MTDPYTNHKIAIATEYRSGYRDGVNTQCDGRGYPIYTMSAEKKIYWEGFHRGYCDAKKAWFELCEKLK